MLSFEENELKALLDHHVRRINTPDFINEDPVQFPRLFTDLRDIEITSLLVSTIAWGRRPMILRNAARMIALMDNSPYNYMMDEGYEELPDCNLHRTFFAVNFRYYLRGLRSVYKEYGSLQSFAAAAIAGETDGLPWLIAEALSKRLAEANNGQRDVRCLPGDMSHSALKRFNMALRWLVRRDGIVDLGIWDVLKPSQLYIPLDVHVGRLSRQLGMLERKSNDRVAVEQLTAELRRFNAEDPVIYDFALFGLGVGNGLDEQERLNSVNL